MKKHSSTPGEFKLLSQDEIEARRIPVEDAISFPKEGVWHCHYCDKNFSNETIFMRHFCEPKKRAETLQTPIGQAAYSYYREWMRLKKFSIPKGEAFLTSRYFRSFVSFAEMVNSSNLANPERYVALMVEGGIMPALWTTPQAYSVYMIWYDDFLDPIQQVGDSINFLLDICEKDGIELSNVFTHLGPSKIISYIRQRRLSPWFLFCSSAFGQVLRTLDKDQLKDFDSVVKASYWSSKFQESKLKVEEIKSIIKELGL